jgi:branched-chain amino acid transport system permease protein
LPTAASYGLLAAAYSLVYGLFGRINLAFGEIAATGGAAAFLGAALFPEAPGPWRLTVALMFGLWGAAMHGVVIERLVIWPLRQARGQQSLVATIGVALFVQEYLRLAQGSDAKWVTAILDYPIFLARAGAFAVTVTPIALMIAAVAGVAAAAVLAALRFSRVGRDWRATADDATAAALFGVDPKALSLETFALACGLVGLAGAAVTVFYGSLGITYTTSLGLKALIAAIVGGIGSVPGAFLGGLSIALIEGLWSAYGPIVYRDFVIDGLLVAMLVLRPGGLFGYRELSPRRV